jgi:hypothetical protein
MMNSDRKHPRSPKRSRRGGAPRALRRLRQVYGLGVALLIAAGTLTLAPWMTGPDEPRSAIDARWSRIEAIAAPRIPGGEVGLLRDALAAFDESPWEPNVLGPGEDEALDPAALRAIDLLVAWERRGGGVGMGTCIDYNVPRFKLLDLGRAAIAAADGPRDPSLRAVLRLGQQLRARGGIMGGLVGTALAHETLEKVDREGWHRPQELRQIAPSQAEVPEILARDVVCFDTWVTRALERGEFNPEGLAYGPLENHVARYAFNLTRERLHYRAEASRRLLHALAADTPEAFRARIRPAPREDAAPSIFVRSGMDLADRSASLCLRAARYQAALHGDDGEPAGVASSYCDAPEAPTSPAERSPD